MRKTKLSESEIIDLFLEIAAQKISKAEKEAIKGVLETGFSQNRKILKGFFEVRVRSARNGEVIVERRLDEKAFKKAISRKEKELKKRR